MAVRAHPTSYPAQPIEVAFQTALRRQHKDHDMACRFVRRRASAWLVASLILSGSTAGLAHAQDVSSGSPIAMSYAADAPPAADAAPPAQPAAPAPATAQSGAAASAAAESGAGCATCGSGGDGCDCCKLDCPAQDVKRLFADNCWLKCHDVTVQGFAEAGISARDGRRSPDGFNGPDGFNDRDGEIQLNQFYTTIQKALKDNECCWDWGYTVDVLYGTDYRFPLSRGLDARDSGTPKWHSDVRRFYGLALPQAYVEFGTSKLSYKVGHFYTLLGNEVVPAIGNTFYSHTYTFLYAIPFTHTGANATWKPNDQLTLVGGVNDGWDNFNDVNENVSFTSEAIFSAKDKHTTLTFANQIGNEPTGFGDFKNRYTQSIVLAHDWNDRMSYVIENADGWQSDGANRGTDTATWYGIDSYVTYKLNCCWTSALRFEWFRDNNGTRVAPPGDFQGGNVDSPPGFVGNFYDVTAGLQYKPTANIQIRPEIRYDWFQGRDLLGGAPYHNATNSHQWISSCDVIWQY